MGFDPVRHPFLKMIRFGAGVNCALDAVAPTPFAYVVGGGEHSEPWGEGLEVFHNPNAK